MKKYKDLFISYHAHESLSFTGILYQQLKLAGYDIWFDKINIPTDKDSQDKIYNAIENAQNYVFVISPSAIRSNICLLETLHAIKNGKRIIPVMHIEPTAEDWKYTVEQERKNKNNAFATELRKCIKHLQSIDWIYMREKQGNLDELNQWQNSYTENWPQHNDVEYLKNWKCPIKWENIDNFQDALDKISLTLKKDKEYVLMHTRILTHALEWNNKNQSNDFLLPDKEIKNVTDWLNTNFKSSIHTPCSITDLQKNLINKSIKTLDFKEIFISYGRGDSLAFAARLHQRFRSESFYMNFRKDVLDVWFDKVNIPHSDNYQQRINNGIENAQNFVFIISPHSVRSKYCLIEVEYAIKCGKRIIPILHITPDNDDWKHAVDAERKQGNNDFALTLENSINRLQSIDWVYAREHKGNIEELHQWRDSYENHWKQHNDDAYLANWHCPISWEAIDDFELAAQKVLAAISENSSFVFQHTKLLCNTLIWDNNKQATQYLPVGKNRLIAEEWLLTEFIPPKQPPCQPTLMMCQHICEARKNAENMMTNVFICYDTDNKIIRDQIINSLSRYAITTWVHDRDILKGAEYNKAIEQGIEQADNFFFFISPSSVKSNYCINELKYALKFNKRIIPLLISKTSETNIPESLQTIQYIDFTDNTCKQDYNDNIDDIINILNHDKAYYEQHKILLSRALRWDNEARKPSFLLRGFNLENAETWIRINKDRTDHTITDLHREFVTASEAAKGQMGTEVFISYSRKDGDLARQLNIALQQTGKTTWFDQESISSGVDFEKEIFKGITASDNFVFIISPDAIESEYCEREVNFATEHNKRIITLNLRQTDATIIPEALRHINWINFEDVSFEKAFAELITALDIDRNHARQHTILQQRATEWNEQKQNSDLLMNKTATIKAEKWLTNSKATPNLTEVAGTRKKAKQPVPTDIQIDYISQSRNAITQAEKLDEERNQKMMKLERDKAKRQKVFTLLVAIALIFAVAFAVYGFYQKSLTEDALTTAEDARKSAEKATLIADEARIKEEQSKKEVEKLLEKQSTLLLEIVPKNIKDHFTYFIRKGDSAFYAGNYEKATNNFILAKTSKKEKNEELNEKINLAIKSQEILEKANENYKNNKFIDAVTDYKTLTTLYNMEDAHALNRIEHCNLFIKELKNIKGGSFMMGNRNLNKKRKIAENELPSHKVTLSDFSISKFEITNQQFANFLSDYGSKIILDGEYKDKKMFVEKGSRIKYVDNRPVTQKRYEKHPVTNVTWYGANEFCRFYGGRLPTEAEWEFTARAGRNNTSSKFSGSDEISEIAHYTPKRGKKPNKTTKVGEKKPNSLYIYDMTGNVKEWCADFYSGLYYKKSSDKDPTGPEKGKYKVSRGGSWKDIANNCRVAKRSYNSPDKYSTTIGFRFAK